MTDRGMEKLAEDLQRIDDIYRKVSQERTTDNALNQILFELNQYNVSIGGESLPADTPVISSQTL